MCNDGCNEAPPIREMGHQPITSHTREDFAMNKLVQAIWAEDDGVLSFEWVMLVTLLTIGIVSGLAGARDAIIDELGDVSEAMLAVDQSYTIDFPLEVIVHAATTSTASDSAFEDAFLFIDCTRNVETNLPGQVPQIVEDSIDGG
ncbi:hypothetical protein Psta_1085 [Pirellula staleyi DSM 6068]|uniref:Uncharacterized protein n=1 Tax=Pirellula staleyi (strain ATCC 27377 / DSM 6068 / ICPB 4128) TaxID=530564 RepID=D2R8F1_PIRSD|nr:hypothetical protein Psta_1085 [Pirellula staleyi DSM 6068]